MHCLRSAAGIFWCSDSGLNLCTRSAGRHSSNDSEPRAVRALWGIAGCAVYHPHLFRFFISNIILSGKTLHTVVPAIPVRTATVIGAIAATTIGVIGYHFIHKFNKIGTWFMGGSLLIGLMIMVPHINADVLAKGSFNMKGWFAMFGLCAVWQISFSPYTSDYSRYLPKSIGIYKPFIFTYLGASLGTILRWHLVRLRSVLAQPQMQWKQ